MIRKTLPLLLVLALTVAVAGCGSKSSNSDNSAAGGAASAQSAPADTSGGATSPAATAPANKPLAKTKFVLHAALAFGVFHRWIYKPFRSGVLARPLSHKIAVIKAILAGAFVIHEAKLAYAAAQGSPILRKLTSPLTAVISGVTRARTSLLHGGAPDSSSITQANSAAARTSAESGAAGQPITESTAGAPAGLA